MLTLVFGVTTIGGTALAANYSTEASAPKKVKGLQVTEVKKKAATITWKKRKAASYYKVQLLGKKGKKLKTWKKHKKKKRVIKKKYKILKPGKTYYYRVKACNSAGCSKWSKKKKFQTEEKVEEQDTSGNEEVVEEQEPVVSADCSYNKYNCSDFSTHSEAQSTYQYCVNQGVGDIHDLDRDGNGSACESLR